MAHFIYDVLLLPICLIVDTSVHKTPYLSLLQVEYVLTYLNAENEQNMQFENIM